MRIACAHIQYSGDAAMRQIYNINAPKKPTNLSVNSDLLYEAKALKLNLSATFEAALLNELKAARRDKWIAENKQAIDTCNKLANEHRLFADKHREF